MKYYYGLCVLIMSVMIGCSDTKDKKDTGEKETVSTVLPEETPEVTTMKLEPSTFNHELISNGKLSAKHLTDLKFESSEPVAEIYVKNGDHVRKGQKIAELAAFKLSNNLSNSKSSLEKAKLELQDVLIGQGYKLEDTAKVPAATMKLAKVKSGYDQAQTQYELAKYEYDHAVLKAPFDGIIANLFSKQYNVPSSTEAFCSVIDNNSLEADFMVLESELPLIKTGDIVEITSFAVKGLKSNGRITEINPLVDKNGMVRVKAAVGSQGKLFEGMNVRVSIKRNVPNQLVVPKESVVLRSGKQVVFTLKDGKAMWNYVQTGLENAESYTIADDGIKAGDTVITSGNVNLAHEAPVKVVETNSED